MMPPTNGQVDHFPLFMGVLGSILILWASFTDKIPAELRYHLSTTAGRLFCIAGLYAVYTFLGFLPAFIYTIAIALTWANRPLTKPVEGFLANIKKTPINGKPWFSERIVGESAEIVEDRVDTYSVQDSSSSQNAKTSR